MTTPFVAREMQIAQLMGALERAAAGRPGVILLGADAGVGKTRLLHRAAGLAVRSGATVVTGHCVDLGEIGLPYLPFAETLGQICNGELDEIFQTRQWDQTRQQYERRIYGKTAALFATAAEFGGILSGAPASAVDSLRCYGTSIGMGFQIVVDVLDLRENSE